MKSFDVIRRFINGVTSGAKSETAHHFRKKDRAYDIGFNAGFANKDNPKFMEQFLQFWIDYTKFMAQPIEIHEIVCDEDCEDTDILNEDDAID